MGAWQSKFIYTIKHIHTLGMFSDLNQHGQHLSHCWSLLLMYMKDMHNGYPNTKQPLQLAKRVYVYIRLSV